MRPHILLHSILSPINYPCHLQKCYHSLSDVCCGWLLQRVPHNRPTKTSLHISIKEWYELWWWNLDMGCDHRRRDCGWNSGADCHYFIYKRMCESFLFASHEHNVPIWATAFGYDVDNKENDRDDSLVCLTQPSALKWSWCSYQSKCIHLENPLYFVTVQPGKETEVWTTM